MKRMAMLLAIAAGCLDSAVIIADTSDFSAHSNGGMGDSDLWDTTTGDLSGQPPSLGSRSLFRFSLAGLSGQTIQGAMFHLTLAETRKDQYPAPGIITSAPPFINPGLGDLWVAHVPDYVTPNGAAFYTASLGNDPGVLVPGAVNPNSSVLSIDVTNAMQQAINANLAFVTFRLQTAVLSDDDGLNDVFNIDSADNPDVATRPQIVLSLAENGGADVPEPSSGALALIAMAIACAARRRRDRTPTQSRAPQR